MLNSLLNVWHSVGFCGHYGPWVMCKIEVQVLIWTLPGSSTLLWAWALYCVQLLSSGALQLKLSMAVACALYPA